MNILIVEDDFITSQVLKEILSEFGVCTIAENGKEAIEEFNHATEANNKFDVIFLDIMMPELDGQETLNHIRMIERENGIQGLEGVKIIMTTALDDFENIKSAFKSQCEGYMVKPVDRNKIARILKELGFLN